jgi:xylulokinase
VPLVLGVDSSTQSTKVEVRDADDGTLVASSRAPHPAAHPPRSEQPPDAWWHALVAACGSIEPSVLRGVGAMSVAGQQHGLVVLDAAGQPLRDAKLWNDTESAPEAQELVDELGATAWAEAVGSVPLAAFTISKLAWLARHEPATLATAHHLLLPHDFLNLRIAGRAATDRGDASGTGYFDPSDGGWRVDVLEQFVGAGAWCDRLPEVLGPREVVDEVTAPAAGVLGLGGSVLVASGTGDNMAAALGIGLDVGSVALSLGTSGTVYAAHDRPTADPTGTVAGFADATGRYLPLVCTLNATRVTATIAGWLGVTEAELDSLAAGAAPGSGGVAVVPYFDGERTPNRPDATGTIVGLGTGTSREELAPAAHDGVVCGLLDGLDALVDATGAAPEQIVLVGGGARSIAYRRAVADLSGLPVLVPDCTEQVATGACVQAAAVLTHQPFANVQAAWNLTSGTTIGPDDRVDRAEIRARYRAAAST